MDGLLGAFKIDEHLVLRDEEGRAVGILEASWVVEMKISTGDEIELWQVDLMPEGYKPKGQQKLFEGNK